MKKIYIILALTALTFARGQNNPQASQVPQHTVPSDSSLTEKITSEKSVKNSDAVKTDHQKITPAKAANDTVHVRKGKKK